MGLYSGRRKRLHGKERSAVLEEGAPSVGPGGEVGAWGADDEDRHTAAWRSTDSVIHLTSNLIVLEDVQ